MKTAKELYPIEDIFYRVWDYQPMLEEIGEILIQVDDRDYQGDSRILYKDGIRIGYLNFGWGSCSGCDALLACESIEEVQKLFESLIRQVRWFDSIKEAYDYFINKDWSLDYSWDADEQKEFIVKVISYLTKALNRGKGETNETSE